MKFSIIIPLYNKAPYIANTIQSVLNQRMGDFELIVIDDGSTDASAAEVEKIKDPRIHLVRQPNQGVSATRNLGIALAEGEWIGFLDADDWQDPGFLAAIVRAQALYPQADTIGTEFISITHSGASSWPPSWPHPVAEPEIELIQDFAKRWMQDQTLCTSSTTVRASRLKAMQPCFALGESQGEDLDLFFRLGEVSPVVLVRSKLVAYRKSVEGSLSSSHDLIGLPPFLHRMRQRALSGALTPAQRDSALWLVSQYELGVAREALGSGRRLEGIRWLLKGRRAATGSRWWITAAMVFLFPASLVQNWQSWRMRRTIHGLDAHDAGAS